MAGGEGAGGARVKRVCTFMCLQSAWISISFAQYLNQSPTHATKSIFERNKSSSTFLLESRWIHLFHNFLLLLVSLQRYVVSTDRSGEIHVTVQVREYISYYFIIHLVENALHSNAMQFGVRTDVWYNVDDKDMTKNGENSKNEIRSHLLQYASIYLKVLCSCLVCSINATSSTVHFLQFTCVHICPA